MQKIQQAGIEDYPAMLNLWQTSVDATHHFLAATDKEKIARQLQDVYFPAMDELWLIKKGEKLSGFLGLNPAMVEMLFVHPDEMGQGMGRYFLDFSQLKYPDLRVDVNEQNEQAYRFYLHYGFKVIGRSEQDAAGMPYPIIHMQL